MSTVIRTTLDKDGRCPVSVRPVNGAKVINPETGLELPEEGAIVNWNSYWVRRITDGSVMQAPLATPATAEQGE